MVEYKEGTNIFMPGQEGCDEGGDEDGEEAEYPGGGQVIIREG